MRITTRLFVWIVSALAVIGGAFAQTTRSPDLPSSQL
jgi:hypothetical protein